MFKTASVLHCDTVLTCSYTPVFQKKTRSLHFLLLIPHSFDWLAALHLELLQAILFTAV